MFDNVSNVAAERLTIKLPFSTLKTSHFERSYDYQEFLAIMMRVRIYFAILGRTR